MHIPFYILKLPHQNKKQPELQFDTFVVTPELASYGVTEVQPFLKIYILSKFEYIFLLEYHFIDDVVFQLRAAGHCCMLETRGKSRENRAKP